MGVIPPILGPCLKQLFKKPFTNLFPDVPPIPTPGNYRGIISYDRDKCAGCGSCAMVCPSGAIDFVKEERRIRIWIVKCAFCAQCTSTCPKDALFMTEEFLSADYDKHTKEFILE